MEFSVVVLLQVLLLGMQAIPASVQVKDAYFRSQIGHPPDSIESRSRQNGEASPVSDEGENLEMTPGLKNDDSALKDLLRNILDKSGYQNESPVGSMYRHRGIPQKGKDFLIAYKVLDVSELSNIHFKNENGQALPLPGGSNKVFMLNGVVKSHNIPGVRVYNDQDLSLFNIADNAEVSYRTQFQNTADQQDDGNWHVDLAIDNDEGVSKVSNSLNGNKSEPSSIFNDEQGDVVPLDDRITTAFPNSGNDTKNASADENLIHGDTSAGQQLNSEMNLIDQQSDVIPLDDRNTSEILKSGNDKGASADENLIHGDTSAGKQLNRQETFEDKHIVDNVSDDGKTSPTSNFENGNQRQPIRV